MNATPRTWIGPGATIDGFTVGARIHKGSMAALWEVTHPTLPGPLLIKAPILSEGVDPASIVGFEMELMILPRLSGPHVPRFVAAGDYASPQPYIVMERIPGASLLPMLHELPLAAEQVASIGLRVATALDDLHRQNVVHLDVKPSNILVRPTGEMVLIDFGLSYHDELPDLMGEEFRLPYGTAPYMAPEQVLGHRRDPRSDLFALGVLLYFFTTGVRPFGDPQRLAGLKRRIWWDPPPPRKLRPDCPPWLQEIILRCLEVKPEWRYPSAGQLAFDLQHPAQVTLTARSEKLARDRWTARLRRRFNEDLARPVRRGTVASHAADAPIVAVAIDLSESAAGVAEALRGAVEKVLGTSPGARLACLNVLKQGMITLDRTVDDDGQNVHLGRLIELRAWAEPLKLAEGRVTFHVLEAPNPASEILRYVYANRVDHLVIGARAGPTRRARLGSVSAEVATHAPCTVTVVRRPRRAEEQPADQADQDRDGSWTVG